MFCDDYFCGMYTYNDFLDFLWGEDRKTVAALQKPDLALHLEKQDYTCEAWHKLLELIEIAAKDGREIFVPKKDLGEALWMQIRELPPEISKLKAVRVLNLYRSNLVLIPPEIGEMESLEEFIPYTSYGLHWFPYEITHCKKLVKSTVSTRALFGNFKYRSPFPRLNDPEDLQILKPKKCSVCGATLDVLDVKQAWISLRVAQDVLPLLVNACSQNCIDCLPVGEQGYIEYPHEGGDKIIQPECRC